MQRRTVLQTIGTAMVGAIAGCTTQLQSSENQSPPTTSDQPNTDTSSETTNSLSKPITADDIRFNVTVLRQFTKAHPAQINVSFRNESNTRLTLAGGPILPFTDLDGIHQNRDARLLLIPNDNDWITPSDGEGNILDVPLVPASRMDGCWTVKYRGMLREQSMLVTELSTGETISHTYTLLDWTNESCLPTGSYAFSEEHSLQRGGISAETEEFEARLGFLVEVDAERKVSVTAQDPTVGKQTH